MRKITTIAEMNHSDQTVQVTQLLLTNQSVLFQNLLLISGTELKDQTLSTKRMLWVRYLTDNHCHSSSTDLTGPARISCQQRSACGQHLQQDQPAERGSTLHQPEVQTHRLFHHLHRIVLLLHLAGRHLRHRDGRLHAHVCHR